MPIDIMPEPRGETPEEKSKSVQEFYLANPGMLMSHNLACIAEKLDMLVRVMQPKQTIKIDPNKLFTG